MKKILKNPFRCLTKKEWSIWIVSLIVVIASNILSGDFDLLTLVAALTGVTSLILAAKGNVWAQILIIVFSILYGIISWQFRYWGEMITYMGMCMPMAIWSTITWIRNPSEENENEVAIQKLNRKHIDSFLCDRYRCILLYFRIFEYTESCIKYGLCCNQFSGGSTHYAAFFFLCIGICIE